MFFLIKKSGLFVLLAMALSSPAVTGKTGGKLPSVEGRYFEVVGTDYRSVSYVNELGTHIVEICSRYLQPYSNDVSQRIFVALRPEDRVDFEGDYQIRQMGRGGVSLDIRWEEPLTQESLCYALVEAYVSRYAFFNHGPQSVEAIRLWAISALASQSYLSLRPAQQISYVQQALIAELPELRALLQLSSADGAKALSPHVGYWVMASLGQYGFDRILTGDFLRQAIAGVDVSVELEELIQSVDFDSEVETLESWWEHQITALLSADNEVYETMEVSFQWLRLMVDFESSGIEAGEITNLRSLWKHRDDEALRAMLSARSEIIRLRLDRVNPAYYNAAHSLAVLFEAVLNGERMASFIHALASYLSDWEDAKRLHQQVVDALDAG